LKRQRSGGRLELVTRKDARTLLAWRVPCISLHSRIRYTDTYTRCSEVDRHNSPTGGSHNLVTYWLHECSSIVRIGGLCPQAEDALWICRLQAVIISRAYSSRGYEVSYHIHFPSCRQNPALFGLLYVFVWRSYVRSNSIYSMSFLLRSFAYYIDLPSLASESTSCLSLF
jgi:hypothetical protein